MLPLSDYTFLLPPELIAQAPASPRDSARLFCLDKKTGEFSHHIFRELPKLLRAGDVLVFNHSKVFPARLAGKKIATGGRSEVFLLRDASTLPDIDISKYETAGSKVIWQCLVGGKARSGIDIQLPGKVIARLLEDQGKGTWLVAFLSDAGKLTLSSFMKYVESHGSMPLPPYIKDNNLSRERYQTVYADPRRTGSVAAPTAGLHFTARLLKALKAKNIQTEYVTLHVGLGTFAPIKEEDVTKHDIHSEWYEIDLKTKARLEKAKKEGRRIIAVGTTSARVLETAFTLGAPLSGWTKIFIYPGYKFNCVDALITNFHLPHSSLLLLVSALAGRENILSAYSEAIKEKYKFYSYGDAMLIE
jgi:S-adenosylmethionine:tRNA ribosyltransferase-isomerase